MSHINLGVIFKFLFKLLKYCVSVCLLRMYACALSLVRVCVEAEVFWCTYVLMLMLRVFLNRSSTLGFEKGSQTEPGA